MKEILEKLSSYNLFNYLLPGIVFAVLAARLTHYNMIQQDLVIGAFVYYFVGLVTSRFGSLVIEPLLKWTRFVRFAEYKQFVVASKSDPKVEILSEANNSYRTLCAMFVLLLILRGFERVCTAYPSISKWDLTMLLVLLFFMFLFAYKKQTAYITKRIDANQEKVRAAGEGL